MITVIEVSFAKGSYTAAESSGSVALQLRVDGRYNIDFQVEVECRDTDPVSAQGGNGTQISSVLCHDLEASRV